MKTKKILGIALANLFVFFGGLILMQFSPIREIIISFIIVVLIVGLVWLIMWLILSD